MKRSEEFKERMKKVEGMSPRGKEMATKALILQMYGYICGIEDFLNPLMRPPLIVSKSKLSFQHKLFRCYRILSGGDDV